MDLNEFANSCVGKVKVYLYTPDELDIVLKIQEAQETLKYKETDIQSEDVEKAKIKLAELKKEAEETLQELKMPEVTEETPYLVLSEMTILEYDEIQKAKDDSFSVIKKIFPKKIIEHNFGSEIKNEQINAKLMESASLYNYVIEEWTKAFKLKKRTYAI